MGSNEDRVSMCAFVCLCARVHAWGFTGGNGFVSIN